MHILSLLDSAALALDHQELAAAAAFVAWAQLWNWMVVRHIHGIGFIQSLKRQ